jgi:hypothetical protein
MTQQNEPIEAEVTERDERTPVVEADVAEDALRAPGPLFPGPEAEGLRREWRSIQTAFVDEPRRAVERADELVARVARRLTEVFGAERTALEQRWGQGGNVSTEDLRLVLQRYRSFFDRLLAV